MVQKPLYNPNKPIQKVLVVFKKSALQLAKERKNQHILNLLEKGDPSVSGYKEAHDAHMATLKEVEIRLNKWFDKVDLRYRANATVVKNYDLVVTVGGDGTFLWASKFVPWQIPIVGINSDPNTSVGFFTCADRTSVGRLAHDLKQGSLVTRTWAQRLSLKVNGKIVHNRILNDVLFAAAHPAAMTRYILIVPGNDDANVTETQKSSGIWVSTAAGSTGANLSAGGWILQLDDERIQYIVREPMKNLVWGTEHRYTHGLVKKEQSVKFLCKTRKALLACDGTTGAISVTTGDIIEITQSDDPLTILYK